MPLPTFPPSRTALTQFSVQQPEVTIEPPATIVTASPATRHFLNMKSPKTLRPLPTWTKVLTTHGRRSRSLTQGLLSLYLMFRSWIQGSDRGPRLPKNTVESEHLEQPVKPRIRAKSLHSHRHVRTCLRTACTGPPGGWGRRERAFGSAC